jgi:hypothetical protein
MSQVEVVKAKINSEDRHTTTVDTTMLVEEPTQAGVQGWSVARRYLAVASHTQAAMLRWCHI